MGRVVEIWSKLVNSNEPDITMELDHIVYSKKHGHEICVMHLVGKNIFPKMTTEEILSSPQSLNGISPTDLVTITRLDANIKNMKSTNSVVEKDINGTILLENKYGKRKRYSEKLISQDRGLLDSLMGSDAYGLGHRVGFKEGRSISKKKVSSKTKLLSLLGIK